MGSSNVPLHVSKGKEFFSTHFTFKQENISVIFVNYIINNPYSGTIQQSILFRSSFDMIQIFAKLFNQDI